MEKQKNILLVIIVLALGIAVILFGRSFFVGGGITLSESPVSTQNILPYGAGLDFSKIENFTKDKRSFVYPQVNPVEVGLGLGQIVK